MRSELEALPDRPSRGAVLKTWVRALEYSKIVDENPDLTLPGIIDDLAREYRDNLALIGEDGQLSFHGLAAQCNRIARWGAAQGLGRGDVVCLLMPNCPEYVAIWLGLTRIGCTVALLNTNLTGEALLHCIDAAASSRIIVAGALRASVAAIETRLPAGARCWVYDDIALGSYDDARMQATEHFAPGGGDRALLIYTSGTTGLPKAANVSHSRIMEWSYWFAGMMDTQPTDRLYNCLPMYHSIGGVVAVGAMLVKGGGVVVRARFSARRFWHDVVTSECTIFQYIGELCRYLVQSPADPRERRHRLRLCCGNGMRGDVWERFQMRFGIPRVLEFYAATEGSVSLYNCEGVPGAIGRVPAFLAHRFPVALIRCDPDTGAPVRDASGFCMRCGDDEPGEAIGRMYGAESGSVRPFQGYTDARASERKVLRDVFAADDLWYRTGDLMRKDAAGFYFFVDRLGDTFRWKGENVSTTEVEAAIGACPGIVDAAVYGVAVPGHEGRAGMAAIVTDAGFDFAAFAAHVAARLPDYARPVFVRVCGKLDVTGTFKLMKGPLAREGYGPSADAIWFFDRTESRFVPCDEGLRRGLAVTRL